MNLKVELQPIFAVNTFPPRLHEVAGPWLSTEKGEKKGRGPLKRCFVLVSKGLRLLPVRGCGCRPAARPSDPLAGRDQTTIWCDGPFLNCSVSCTEPGWVEPVRPG